MKSQKTLYQNLNDSFTKRLVYNLGSDAGFFSEYNNMILGMIYCLKHEIRFELFSNHKIFLAGEGWDSFFEPFCQEQNQFSLIKSFSRYTEVNPGPIRKMKMKLVKKLYKLDFLTSEIWGEFRNDRFAGQYFDFPSLNIYGGIQDVCQSMITETWKFNQSTFEQVNALKASLGLPSQYVGIHLRGGDKSKEHEVMSVESYMLKMTANCELKDVFVLTDDFRIYESLVEKYPEFSFYTLCPADDRGYIHDDFIKNTQESRKSAYYRLFAGIDLMAESEMVVCTYSSNPGMYLGMRMPVEKVKGIDFDRWRIW